MSDDPANLEKIVSDAAAAEVPAVVPVETFPPDPLPDLGISLLDHKLAFQLDCLEQELKALKETHGLRLAYTGRIFWLVVTWLACVVICVVLSGFKMWAFSLSDSVLIAFITSTTVNVVGLFVLVAKWMFPSGKEAPDGKELHTRASTLSQRDS